MTKTVKIPVHHYIEVKGLTTQQIMERVSLESDEFYIANESGKQYLVEVWA